MTQQPPPGALLEADLGDGLALYDVEGILPRHPGPLPWRKRYRKRSPVLIGYAAVHKSGADGPPGFRGMRGSARFVVDHRGWQAFAYTYWFSRIPDIDAEGREVVYRGNADEVRSFHTGGSMNTLGVGLGVQGNYDGDADGVIERTPTEFQFRALAAMVPWLAKRHRHFDPRGFDEEGRHRLTGHWEHGKPVCPGDALVAWVRAHRGEVQAMAGDLVAAPSQTEVDPEDWGRAERQMGLALLGHDPGPVDGRWGYRSRAALERFQVAHGLVVDGVWGAHSAAAMLRSLRGVGLAERSKFHA